MTWLVSLLTSLGVYAPEPVLVPEPEPIPVRRPVPPRPAPTKPLSPEEVFLRCGNPPTYTMGFLNVAIAIGPRDFARAQAAAFRSEVQSRDSLRTSNGEWPDYDRTPLEKRISLWAVHTTTIPWYGGKWAAVVTDLPVPLAIRFCLWLHDDCGHFEPPEFMAEWTAWPSWVREQGGRTCVLMLGDYERSVTENPENSIDRWLPARASDKQVLGGLEVWPSAGPEWEDE